MSDTIELQRRIQRLEKQLDLLMNPTGLVSTPGLLRLYESLYIQGHLNVDGTLAVNGMTKTGTGVVTNLNADLLDGFHAPTVVGSYTPTWGSNGVQPAIGNGTLTGKTYALGKLIFAQVSLLMGTTTTYGTGTYYITLPSTPLLYSACAVHAFDAGTSHYRMVGRCTSANNQVSFSLDTGSNVTPTYPFTWTTSDMLIFMMPYFEA